MLRRRARTIVIVVALATFVALTVVVGTGHAAGLDHAAQRWAHHHFQHWLRATARVVTDVLSPPVDAAALVAGAVVLALRRRRRDPLAVAVAVVVVVSAVVLGVKHGIGRPPPYLPPSATGASFPSGHTAATAAFLGALVVLSTRPGRTRRLLLLAVAAATAVCAAALVYAGYHWLTDTLASAALGIAAVTAVTFDRRGRLPGVRRRRRDQLGRDVGAVRHEDVGG